VSMSVQRRWVTLSVTVISAGALVIAGASPASAAPIGLGEATSFSVLAGQTVTNTGSSVISGNVGVSPLASVTGFFPPGIVTAPASIFGPPAADGPKADLTAAYLVAAGLPGATPLAVELGNSTLVPGVYSGGTFGISAGPPLVLDAGSDPNAVWVFQVSSTLITGSGSVVSLINGASACNVFWQVGSSATLGSDSTMVGTVMALTDIDTGDETLVTGRLLARNGEVRLINTTINTPPACIAASSFSGPGGVPLPAAGPSLPVMGVDLPWLAWSLSLVAILAGATGVVVSATRRRAARS